MLIKQSETKLKGKLKKQKSNTTTHYSKIVKMIQKSLERNQFVVQKRSEVKIHSTKVY